MKKSLLILFVLSLTTLSLRAQEEAIYWEKDFKKAKLAARETNRPMLLDFTASWCKPCKAMDAQFWVLPEVVEAAKPFIAVKIDYDDQKELVSRYGVSAIPFVVFTDPLGNLITFRRGFGSKNAKEINQIFNEMPKDFSAMRKSYDALDANKDDGRALLQIADSYRAAKMVYLSSEYYKRALKTDEVKTDAEKKERVTATLGANYFSLRRYKEASEYLDDYLKDYPAGKSREIALAMIAVSCANLDKDKDAAKYLDQLKREFPASKNIEAAARAIAEAKNKPDKK